MFNLSQIESDLKVALKNRNLVTANTLRGLKTRLQNEQIEKMRDLKDEELLAIIRSEIKRRQDAASAFKIGERHELEQKELEELKVLENYMPAQMPEHQLKELAIKFVTENNFTVKDFGVAMGKFKTLVGSQADGASMAKVLKEILK